MNFEIIKTAILNAVDSIVKSLGVEMRALVIIAFLVEYLIERF